MLSYSGKNELDNSTFNLNSDFFLWLVNRLYYTNNKIDVNEDELCINAIKGFKGDTEDSQTKLSASGESVMNVISALSFFLESKQLKNVEIELSYGSHTKIDVSIKSNVLDVNLLSYIGEFDKDAHEEMKAKLNLLVFLEIIPLLIQEYQTDKENDEWNNKCYLDFISDIADTIADKIERKKKNPYKKTHLKLLLIVLTNCFYKYIVRIRKKLGNPSSCKVLPYFIDKFTSDRWYTHDDINAMMAAITEARCSEEYRMSINMDEFKKDFANLLVLLENPEETKSETKIAKTGDKAIGKNRDSVTHIDRVNKNKKAVASVIGVAFASAAFAGLRFALGKRIALRN